MIFNGHTKLNTVIGYPLSHSKSPLLHNFIYRRLNINAVMLALENPKIGLLARIIKNFPSGLTCVTMPFKQAIMPFLDSIDERAKAIGAVNTVINKKGKLFGFNTDIDGIAFALRKVKPKNKTVLLLGAGGAARAAAYFLGKSGAKILYLNRTQSKALRLKKEFGGVVINPADLSRHQASVIINATSVGMNPKIFKTPFDKKYLKKGQVVFDVIYSSQPTRLLKEAKQAGATAISGMDMFIGQALRQIELYTGKKMDVIKLSKTARKILSR